MVMIVVILDRSHHGGRILLLWPMVMVMMMLMEEPRDPGHAQTQKQGQREQNTVMMVKLQFRKKVAQGNAEEHAYCKAQSGPQPDGCMVVIPETKEDTDEHPDGCDK